MKSIPMAFGWEFLAHGKWTMLMGFAWSLLLPIFILSAIPELGTSLKDTPVFIMLHVFFTLLGMFLLAVSVVSACEPVTRLRTLPVSNPAIVLLRLSFSMIAMAVLVSASLLILRTLYQVHWPLLGPVL